MTTDGLGREQILRGAIELLDAEGVAGLSMRKLGTRLGSGATSIYWYVKDKDTLVALAGDEVFGELELPDPGRAGWRDAAAASAESLRAVMVRHPWLVPVFSTHAVYGPNIARYQEHSLGVFETAGFTGPDLDRAGSALFSYVLGAAHGEGAPGDTHPDRDAEAIARGREVAAAFPRVLARYDALAASDPQQVTDESFAFGLEVVLDGLAARLA
ncbi:MAG: TetR/AcrR family transcriptional regulator [Pseudonocardia sediminis]